MMKIKGCILLASENECTENCAPYKLAKKLCFKAELTL